MPHVPFVDGRYDPWFQVQPGTTCTMTAIRSDKAGSRRYLLGRTRYQKKTW